MTVPLPKTLKPVFQRDGLNRLWTLKSDGGLKDTVTHIALGRGLYTPNSEMTGLQDEFMRVPVLDTYPVTPTQYAFYAEAIYNGSAVNEPVGEIAFLLSDGTPLAIYSSAMPEAYMTNAVMFRLTYSLVIDAVPVDSLTFTNTEVYFNLGMQRSIDDLTGGYAGLATDALTKALADIHRDERLTAQDARIAADERNLIETAKDAQAAIDEQAKQFLQLLAWEQHTQAMYRRARGQSGIMAVRQYTYHGDLRGTASSEKGTPGHMHQHPEFGDLVGTGEVWGVINGWTFKARHRDHHMERPAPVGSAWLATEKLTPPPLPPEINPADTVAVQTAAMAELFRRYNAGEFPAGFRADLTALEVWFEPYSSTIEDTFHSKRHALQTSSMTDALRLMMHYANSGLKDRFENQAVEMPLVAWVDAAGNPQLGILRYRMVCTALDSMGDVRRYLEPIEDLSFDEGSWGRSSQRYRVIEGTNAPGALDTMLSLLPGLDGTGANLTETHTRYGKAESIRQWSDGNAPLNAAYYNRFAQALGDDAANRHHFIRGDYDPYLFVASNTRAEVLPMTLGATTYRWSWAIPMEIVIRTPLESWNPYNVPTVADSGNHATAGTQANPIRGLNPAAGAYFMTPADLFAGASNAEAADTATGEFFVKCGDGVARKMRASGIWMTTPPIVGAGAAKIRYSIHPEHQEGDKPYAFAMGAYRKNAGVSAMLMADNLSAMSKIIENKALIAQLQQQAMH